MSDNVHRGNVALVTWLGGPSYGTVLQAYALQEVLKGMGYDVLCLEKHGILWGLKHLVNTVLSFRGMHLHEADDPDSLKMSRVRAFQNETFLRRNIVLGMGLHAVRRWADVFVCGSDQIWNTYNQFDPFLFLSCAGDVKKVSYAPSIGTRGIKPEYTAKVRTLLEDFDSISLREESGAGVISALTSRCDVQTVLDPTFLLGREEWLSFASGSADDISLSDQYVLCYLMRRRDDYESILATVRNVTGIKDIVVVPASENPDISIEGATYYRDGGPREFVRLLSGASLVVTDSFHGMALSIVLDVDFVPLRRFDDADKMSQNIRIKDMLVKFGLESLLPKEGFVLQRYDRQKTAARLEKERRKSFEYLKKSLEV